MSQRHVVSVPGKPYIREIDISRLCAYLRARGWTDQPELVVPHERGPHLFVHPSRGGQVYFADGWGDALGEVICAIADIEGMHPADVLDGIAAAAP